MKQFLRFIFALIINYSVIATLSDILNYGLGKWTVFFIVLSVNLFIGALLFNMKILKWISIFTGSMLFILFSLMLVFQGYILLPASITDYAQSLFSSVFYSTYITPDMFLSTTIIISTSISLLIYILIQKYTAYITIYLIVFIFFASLIIGGFKVNFIYFLIFIFTSLLMYFEKYFNQKIQKTKTSMKLLKLVPTLLIFAILLTSAASLSSLYRSDPVRFVDTIVDVVQSINFGTRIGKQEEAISYDTDKAFSQGSGLSDKTIVLRIESPSNFKLRSQTYDYYDGKNWSISSDLIVDDTEILSGNSFLSVNSYEAMLNYYFLNNLESLDPSALSVQESLEYYERSLSLYNLIEMKITYENIRTKAIFSPSDTNTIEFTEDTSLSIDKLTGIVSSSKTLEKGFTYTLKFIVLKGKGAKFVELLRKADKSSLSDELNLRFDFQPYLQIPETVPQRVKDLAVAVTSTFDNEYDKLRAIEKYLSSNYDYSLEVDRTPSNRDFVDYFLFDQTTGYCTYYASSMVIMARSIGIPARYVRGYVMPKKTPIEEIFDALDDLIDMDKFIDDNIYWISEKQSHAWPEIYIDGYGWLAFEPTAAYYSDFLPQEENDNIYVIPDQKLDTDKDPGASGLDDRIVLYIRIILISFLIILMILPFVIRSLKKMRYSRYDNRKKVLLTFKKIVTLFKLIDQKLMPYETARTYAQKIDVLVQSEGKTLENIIYVFEKAKYSDDKISYEDVSIIENYYLTTRRELFNSTKRFKKLVFYFTNKL